MDEVNSINDKNYVFEWIGSIARNFGLIAIVFLIGLMRLWSAKKKFVTAKEDEGITGTKILDAAGNFIPDNLRQGDKKTWAAKTIQRGWRRSYRAHFLDAKLFGSNTELGLRNKIVIPPSLKNLVDSSEFTVKIPLLQHRTAPVFLSQILASGVIYPRHLTGKTNIATPQDTEKFDVRLVSCSPPEFFTNRLLMVTENLDKKTLASLYFKFMDWAYGASETSITVRLTDKVVVELFFEFELIKARFFSKEMGRCEVTLPGNAIIYYGYEGLNKFISLFIFKVVEKIPPGSQTMHEHIIGEFEKLNPKEFSRKLDSIANQMMSSCSEIAFTSPIKLSFIALATVYFKGKIVDFNQIRNLIDAGNLLVLQTLIEAEGSREIIDNYFIVVGMINYAASRQKIAIVDYVRNIFHETLVFWREAIKEKSGASAASCQAISLVSAPLLNCTSKSLYQQVDSDLTYYVKGGSELRNRIEAIAGKFYHLAGMVVPETTLAFFPEKGTTKKLLASGFKKNFIPVKQLPMEFSALPGCHDGFTVDAWMANWDVVGLKFDNLGFLVEKDRPPVACRLDFSGTLHLRALGEEKGNFFEAEGVPELLTMRDKTINEEASRVFEKVSEEDLQLGASKLKRLTDEHIKKTIYFYLSEPNYAALRQKLVKTLIDRRNWILARYDINQHDTIELIAKDILAQYFQKPGSSLNDGAVHVCRVANYVPTVVNCYHQLGNQEVLKLTELEIKCIQIAALFHSVSEKFDEEDDCSDTRLAGKACKEYLLRLGVKRKEAELMEDAIVNKDSNLSKKKSIYRRILQNASSLDDYQKPDEFDPSRLDLYQEYHHSSKNNSGEKSNFNIESFLPFKQMLKGALKLVHKMQDLLISYSPFEANANEKTKASYERSRCCFSDVKREYDLILSDSEEAQVLPAARDINSGVSRFFFLKGGGENSEKEGQLDSPTPGYDSDAQRIRPVK